MSDAAEHEANAMQNLTWAAEEPDDSAECIATAQVHALLAISARLAMLQPSRFVR